MALFPFRYPSAIVTLNLGGVLTNMVAGSLTLDQLNAFPTAQLTSQLSNLSSTFSEEYLLSVSRHDHHMVLAVPRRWEWQSFVNSHRQSRGLKSELTSVSLLKMLLAYVQ